jgi:hypothetical protein
MGSIDNGYVVPKCCNFIYIQLQMLGAVDKVVDM